MKHRIRGAASVRALSVAEIARLNRAAVRAEHPLTDFVTMTTLGPWNATALAAAPIELIDMERGLLRVPDPQSKMAELALGFDAAVTVSIAAGRRSEGPLFLDPHGGMLVIDDDARDYAAELMAAVDPKTAGIDWTFESLADSIFGHIVDAGNSHHVASAQAGLNPQPHPDLDRRAMLHTQRLLADWWAWRLGLLAPSPFHLIPSFIRTSATAAGRGDGGSHRVGSLLQ